MTRPRLGLEDIARAIKDAGYEAVLPEDTKSATVPIGGMTCAACAKAVERAVGAVPGIKAAAVNFGTERLTVSWDPERHAPVGNQTRGQGRGL
jgi:P-type Cu+ transporter